VWDQPQPQLEVRPYPKSSWQLLAVCQLCCGLAEAGMLARALIAKASANVILLIMLFLRVCRARPAVR
jgi:hypothetical protein